MKVTKEHVLASVSLAIEMTGPTTRKRVARNTDLPLDLVCEAVAVLVDRGVVAIGGDKKLRIMRLDTTARLSLEHGAFAPTKKTEDSRTVECDEGGPWRFTEERDGFLLVVEGEGRTRYFHVAIDSLAYERMYTLVDNPLDATRYRDLNYATETAAHIEKHTKVVAKVLPCTLLVQLSLR